MQTETQHQNNFIIPEERIIDSSNNPFIESNTKEVTLTHLSKDCVIPVFSRDNECTISHHEFINAALEATSSVFDGHIINFPEVRVSHIVKGRVPSAIGKPVKELLENEKTIYYERVMFKIEIPSISEDVNGNKLNLCVGGVRSLNQENLYGRKHLEKFKVFIGFKNLVCTNLCVSSDGSVSELRVSNVNELKSQILEVIGNYEMQEHLKTLRVLHETHLSEMQFAQFIGKCRLYNYLPKQEKHGIPELRLSDGQINSVAKGYYEDEHFNRNNNGSISLWNIYNLLTGAVKSSYIDTFLERSVNSHELIQKLSNSFKNDLPLWYLN
jgi:hypothetical protein